MKKFSIFPIGSCRVNDPIRVTQHLKDPKLLFTHSTKEALQMVEVLLGRKEVPEFYEYKPSSDECNLIIEASQCFVIEVCTKKVFYYQEKEVFFLL
jgi:hypothetical protein